MHPQVQQSLVQLLQLGGAMQAAAQVRGGAPLHLAVTLVSARGPGGSGTAAAAPLPAVAARSRGRAPTGAPCAAGAPPAFLPPP